MTKSYTCIIIDDEEHAIGLLSHCINELYSNIKIIGCYSTWKDGLEAVRTLHADLIFLDISIGGKNGMDILKLTPAIEGEIIFVTAYTEYAIEAFKYAATGYIIKPVGDEEISNSINKAIERINYKRVAKLHLSTPAQTPSNKIGIPSGKGISYFSIEDILYLEAVNNYTKVITKQGEILSSYNLGKFRPMFDGLPFYLVHRSFLVNINCVTRYEASGTIIMSNKKEIPVARNSREDFLSFFNSISTIFE